MWKLESLILDKLANWKLRVGVEVFRLKFVEETSSLETQTGVDVIILSLKSVGWSGNWQCRQNFAVTVVKQNSFFGKPDFAYKTFN